MTAAAIASGRVTRGLAAAGESSPLERTSSSSLERTWPTNRYPRFGTVSMYFCPGCVVVQGLPKHGHRAVQRAFLDEAVRPHLLQQVVFRDQMSAVLDQDAQHGEDLWREGDRPAFAQQPVISHVQTKRPEPIRRLWRRAVIGPPSGQESRREILGLFARFLQGLSAEAWAIPVAGSRDPRRQGCDDYF